MKWHLLQKGRQVSDCMHIPAVPAERSRPGMSTGRITTAALQIVDTEGSQALTMRRLGQALDRKVMTLPVRSQQRRAAGRRRRPGSHRPRYQPRCR